MTLVLILRWDPSYEAPPSHSVNLLFILFRPILFVCRIAQGLGWDYVVLPSSGASTLNSHRLSSLPLNTLQHKSSADAFDPEETWVFPSSVCTSHETARRLAGLRKLNKWCLLCVRGHSTAALIYDTRGGVWRSRGGGPAEETSWPWPWSCRLLAAQQRP